jgi:hypothetical protein
MTCGRSIARLRQAGYFRRLLQWDTVKGNDTISGGNGADILYSDFVNFTNSGGNSIMSIGQDGAGTTYGFVDVAMLNGGVY